MDNNKKIELQCVIQKIKNCIDCRVGNIKELQSMLVKLELKLAKSA